MCRLEDPLKTTDLLKVLTLCHGEMDILLGHLVSLAVDFATLHAKALEI